MRTPGSTTKNGDAKPMTREQDLGYTIGGPVGKPGGNNKLFFFYAHEYRPTNAADQQRQPDPAACADRARARRRLLADAGQQRRAPISATARSRSTPPAPLPGQRDPRPIRSCITLGPGGPEPLSAAERHAGAGDELQLRDPAPPAVENLTQQPAVRLDYQCRSKLRVTGKYSGQRARAAHHARPRSRASPTS